MIDAIHATTNRDSFTKKAMRISIKKAQCYAQAFPMEVMSVTTFKKERTDERSYKLTFTDKDMVGVDTPHNDALVLSVHISMFEVKRFLIDPGSSSEIMYHNLLRSWIFRPTG